MDARSLSNGETVMQLTARQELTIALVSAIFVIAYAVSDIPVWIGLN